MSWPTSCARKDANNVSNAQNQIVLLISKAANAYSYLKRNKGNPFLEYLGHHLIYVF